MQTLFNNDWTPRQLTHNEVVNIKHGDMVVMPMEGYEITAPLPAMMRVYIFMPGTTNTNTKTRNLIDATIASFRANLTEFIGCVTATPGIPRFVLSETSNDARLRTTRSLALAMGLHARLGSESPIHRHMNKDIIALLAAVAL